MLHNLSDRFYNTGKYLGRGSSAQKRAGLASKADIKVVSLNWSAADPTRALDIVTCVVEENNNLETR
jgi:hypothetical protein